MIGNIFSFPRESLATEQKWRSCENVLQQMLWSNNAAQEVTEEVKVGDHENGVWTIAWDEIKAKKLQGEYLKVIISISFVAAFCDLGKE